MGLNVTPLVPKIIMVNKDVGKEWQAYYLAHMLAHYLFDIEDFEKEDYRAVKKDEVLSLKPENIRANWFATYLMMQLDTCPWWKITTDPKDPEDVAGILCLPVPVVRRGLVFLSEMKKNGNKDLV